MNEGKTGLVRTWQPKRKMDLYPKTVIRSAGILSEYDYIPNANIIVNDDSELVMALSPHCGGIKKTIMDIFRRKKEGTYLHDYEGRK